MPDTLQIDSTLVATWNQSSQYDYDRELYGGSQNLFGWLTENILEWIDKKLGPVVDSEVTFYLLLVFGLLLICLLVWLVWRRRSGGFRHGETSPLSYTVEEDTIYGVDFEADIAQMVAQANWHQSVRLVYLHTLRQLADAGVVAWQPSKTPAQYVVEAGVPPFATMSAHFVRVRYGNFSADEILFHQMESLQTAVLQAVDSRKGGGAKS